MKLYWISQPTQHAIVDDDDDDYADAAATDADVTLNWCWVNFSAPIGICLFCFIFPMRIMSLFADVTQYCMLSRLDQCCN